jgi:beta-phosphoglucomutase-like phosphatase (HAD superfamily)
MDFKMIESDDFVLRKIKARGGAFAVVKNPSYVFPPEEYCPLAPALKKLSEIKAVLMDMDGTTTTTEVLCIHALEQMVRRMSGKPGLKDWSGLDHDADFPHIIGNSTTRHVEYLLKKYEEILSDRHIVTAFLEAAWWTLKFGKDPNRQAEVLQNLKKAGLNGSLETILKAEIPDEIISSFAGKIDASGFVTRVNLGIDIYYEVYHRILARLKQGEGMQVKKEIFGETDDHAHVISPMPGIPVLIPLLKGWLGEEADLITGPLAHDYEQKTGKKIDGKEFVKLKERLKAFGEKFEKQPVKLGLVTSSIRYEADIVIHEVLSVITEFISQSVLSERRKEMIIKNLSDPALVYDAFVTATDSSEIRLKPHRDLYSIALHQIGLIPSDFDKVIGFEDSHSGTVAIRAAGIGCCIAVPFAQTVAHNLEAASHVLPGGVPQAVIEFGLFLEE